MKAFLDRPSTLASLPHGLKLATSGLFGFTLASYGVMAALGLERSGWSPTSIADYYAGGGEQYAKTRGELLELTHFHLFAMPLLLFVLGHVFLMASWPARRARLGLFAAAWLGAACDLAAPWLVLYAGREWAWVKLAGRVLLGPALLAFALVPLCEMWSARRVR